ncbi:hypothetical protein [Marinigracilibium pacificum]|uniref:hypothetical protein n=1 Tax=Marinigracilibium pacificum TaxID=2729599 RepID=UPI00232A55AE|nr:hypothetical protein [Marinigracilibium pacificum]
MLKVNLQIRSENITEYNDCNILEKSNSDLSMISIVFLFISGFGYIISSMFEYEISGLSGRNVLISISNNGNVIQSINVKSKYHLLNIKFESFFKNILYRNKAEASEIEE